MTKENRKSDELFDKKSKRAEAKIDLSVYFSCFIHLDVFTKKKKNHSVKCEK